MKCPLTSVSCLFALKNVCSLRVCLMRLPPSSSPGVLIVLRPNCSACVKACCATSKSNGSRDARSAELPSRNEQRSHGERLHTATDTTDRQNGERAQTYHQDASSEAFETEASTTNQLIGGESDAVSQQGGTMGEGVSGAISDNTTR